MRRFALVFMATAAVAACGEGPVEPPDAAEEAVPVELDPLAAVLLDDLPLGTEELVRASLDATRTASAAEAEDLLARSRIDLRALAQAPTVSADAAIAADALALMLHSTRR